MTTRKTGFSLVCATIAAVQCRVQGQSWRHIATHAGVSVTTVKRWVRLYEDAKGVRIVPIH